MPAAEEAAERLRQKTGSGPRAMVYATMYEHPLSPEREAGTTPAERSPRTDSDEDEDAPWRQVRLDKVRENESRAPSPEPSVPTASAADTKPKPPKKSKIPEELKYVVNKEKEDEEKVEEEEEDQSWRRASRIGGGIDFNLVLKVLTVAPERRMREERAGRRVEEGKRESRRRKKRRSMRRLRPSRSDGGVQAAYDHFRRLPCSAETLRT